MQFDDVLEQFTPMIKGCISRWRLYGELDEFEQIGRIALHEAWEKYDPESGPFAPLAKSYVYGRIQQELTRQNRRRERSVAMEHEHMLPDQQDTAGLICLLSFIQSLPLSGREMEWLRLYVTEGSGPSEIAERLGVSVHTVKGWRKQALHKLRALAHQQKLEW
ncbi:sigma-70 family RNA polymerase sigma factor [Alkalicoccus luteus]|uniref:Sigma-70 family RNA polymerase sigma factor n=1 Tax=Alkalicoccus luteus TaxID=1237094 RepID=A0A969PS42_9BACI|nr:sigma-70 family RNA polymerase sigma factor [Alkalicoccus luteus]NJP38353.1 sigma-70 family RNA polymerase sigma factor [Alkalicoccus luteus]